jgi:uncharacterized membrane-anchored protein
MHDLSGLIGLPRRRLGLIRFVIVTLMSGVVASGSAADTDAAADSLAARDQAYLSAQRQSIGAPARADIEDQATVRLADRLILVPGEAAARLLKVLEKPVPPGFEALLIGSEGMEAPGIIRFVAAGFIDSDAALAWTADDMLSSLKDTVTRGNADRLRGNLPEREARRWVQPPHYNAELHQLSWSALIVPKSAPSETDGETTYYAIGFGREGYVELTVVSSLQKAEEIGLMSNYFLSGLNFQPGKGYGDVVPADRRAAAGLAGAMGLAALHKAGGSFPGGDTMVPLVGGIVAVSGAVSLLLYVRRHLRREARRG